MSSADIRAAWLFLSDGTLELLAFTANSYVCGQLHDGAVFYLQPGPHQALCLSPHGNSVLFSFPQLNPHTDAVFKFKASPLVPLLFPRGWRAHSLAHCLIRARSRRGEMFPFTPDIFGGRCWQTPIDMSLILK